MNDIRMKEKRIKDIKKLNKAKAWTERVKDPIVYASKKNKEKINNENNPEEYSEERIKYTTNRIKDELSYSAKKKINKTINNKIIKDSEKKQVPIDNLKKHKEIEETIKKEKTILERGKELAKKGSQKVKNGAKKVGNAGVSAIKGIMKGLKALITSLSGAGVFVLVVILMFSLVMGILFSVFGIFFSSENIENSIKMSDCIEELNDEMDNKINLLKRQQIYDEVVINSNKTSWKDVLSIYAVKVSGGDEEQDVITMDKEKKKILKEVFWDMNNITHNTSIEEYETDSLGTLEDVDFTDVHNKPLNTIQNNNKKTILHININSNNTDEMIKKYNFNEEQIKEFNELTSEKYDNMWYGVIYGSFHDNGEIVNWKQGNKEWANIKIGTTNKTIGGIGCLTTSIAILIKKSGVPTKDIYPFNPGTFVIALNNNYGFDKHGNLSYRAISKAVPNFQYAGSVKLKGMSKSQKLYEIQKYYEKGYYIAIEVKGATSNSQHWVALDSVSNNKILMLDPSIGNETNMWNKYDWNKTSELIYFKAIK